MSRIADYQDAGIFPVQDHEGVATIGSRLMMSACRVQRRPHPESESDPDKSMLQVAKVRGMATIGDVHPWFYWDMVNRSLRDIGMWSMAHSGLTVTGGTGGSKGGSTSTKVKPAGLLPFRVGHDVDGRFTVKFPNYPKCFPSPVQGQEFMVMPGTLESGQSEHMLWADPRLVAPSVEGPGEAGTLVVDLQPEGEMCMAGDKDNDIPGVQGRAARLQSHLRVIPLDANSGMPEAKDLNGLAWNLATSDVTKMPGLGMCWVQMEGQGAVTGGTGTRTQSGPNRGGGGTGQASGGGSPCKFGEFEKKPVNGHGTSLMAQVDASGPFTGGAGSGDLHFMGPDKDGMPITSGHLSRHAYFHMNQTKDGPLFFEDGKWPDPDEYQMVSMVHLVFDEKEDHKWLKGTKPGQWKWFTTVPYVSPDTRGVITPVGSGGGGGGSLTPGGPTTPTPTVPPSGGRPQTPTGVITTQGTVGTPGGSLPGGPGGGGSGLPGPRQDVLREVGQLNSQHRQIWEIFHPMVEGFAQLSFRPQRMVKGLRSFLRNPEATLGEIKADEVRRPQVLSLRTWGGQSATGWNYKTGPFDSRIRGGTVDGGILISPPEFEMESYLGFRPPVDIYGALAESFFTCAPGTGFALGTPHKDGGLGAKSVRITQLGGAVLNDALEVAQLDSSRVAKILFRGELDQASGEVVVDLGTGGNQAARIPSGTTGQRPSSLPPTGGEIRNNNAAYTDTEGNTFESFEYYDALNAAWRQPHAASRLASLVEGDGASLIGVDDAGELYAGTDVEAVLQELGSEAATIAPQAITFTATKVFAHRHARGFYPVVQLLDSDGFQIEPCVDHTDVDTVVLHFAGTLTDAVLILN